MIRTNSLSAKIVSVAFALFLIGLLEAGARLVMPANTRLDDILAILRPDPDLIWKVREDLDVPFQGRRVRTNALGLRNAEIAEKKAGSFRVVCLGESLTFGWGVDEAQTYPRVLEALLRSRLPAGTPVEVVNAGQVGYSSFQGRRFFERVIAPLNPDVITVPYVINDVDRFRFFRSDGRSDSGLAPEPAVLVSIESGLRRSALFRLMMKGAAYLREGQAGPPHGEVRVPEKDYEDNLRAIVRAARERNIFVVFVKMPVNLPVRPALPAGAGEEAGKLLSLGRAQMQSGDPAAAVRTLERAAEKDPYDGDIFAALGSAYAAKKDRLSARRSWARMKDCEACRCRERGDRYNRIMGRVAGLERVPMVDIVSLFARYSAEHGVYLFNDPRNDPIHPTPLGHRLIAGEVAKAIGRNNVVKERKRT